MHVVKILPHCTVQPAAAALGRSQQAQGPNKHRVPIAAVNPRYWDPHSSLPSNEWCPITHVCHCVFDEFHIKSYTFIC
jgi:hypothetical protein